MKNDSERGVALQGMRVSLDRLGMIESNSGE
jgi:hypothetical protein